MLVQTLGFLFDKPLYLISRPLSELGLRIAGHHEDLDKPRCHDAALPHLRHLNMSGTALVEVSSVGEIPPAREVFPGLHGIW
jgi:hypothetical protein